MTSTNKRKLSKGQRVSRTRKERGRQARGRLEGEEQSGCSWEQKLKLLGLPAKGSREEVGERKTVEGNCPRL